MSVREVEPGAADSGDAAAGAGESGPRLFGLSFLALFLELMFIRWVPATVPLVAYYANLLLISSFLGLGLGALACRGLPRLQAAFPLLLLVELALVASLRHVALPGSEDEMRFWLGEPRAVGWVALVALFAANCATFVPIGQRIGGLFDLLQPLRAYAWDLGGSLAGTLAFGLFSWVGFSPLVGFVATALLYGASSPRRVSLAGAAALLAAVGVGWATTERGATWSPYHHLTLQADGGRKAPAAPPPDLRTMRNPPTFVLRVNGQFYQSHGSIDPARYDRPLPSIVSGPHALAHALVPRPRTVLVVGAGGGPNVEAALLAGAERVDAVEIDPGIVAIARRWSASAVYDHPRVRLVTDDARAFLRRTPEAYDTIVYGFLDSQGLSSSLASIRLDGYVYTVEGIRAAWSRLAPDGALSLSFYVEGREWLADKLAAMIGRATGREPLVYASSSSHVVFLVSRGPSIDLPDAIGVFRRVIPAPPGERPVATDDWPYLYLQRRTVPLDYAVVIGALVLAAAATLAWLRPPIGAREGQFALLGVGFLLLQTKSITDCSLYFGATWVVTTVVVAGVLLMVLASNAVCLLAPTWRARFFPLLVALCVVCAVPREWVLGLPLPGRLAWTLLVVPLPILFAGFVFSSDLRGAARPAMLFGANLVGATLGGFLEYLGMVVGSNGLSAALIAAYVAAALCRRKAGG